MATLSSVSADDKLKIIEGSTGDVRTSPGQEHDITVSDLATSLASQTGISSQYSSFLLFTDPRIGGVGDGATDNTTAWNTAMTLLSAGGQLHFPAGVYVINGTTSRVPGGVLLSGTGISYSDPAAAAPARASVIRAGAAMTRLIELGANPTGSAAADTGASMKDLIVDGRDLAVTVVKTAGRRNYIRDCQIYWGSSRAVWFAGQNSYLVGGVVAQNSTGDCVLIDSYYDHRVYDCQIREAGTTGANIRIKDVSDVTVARCHLWAGQSGIASTSQALIAIESFNWSGGGTNVIGIYNNVIEGILGPEILLNASATAGIIGSVNIVGNQFFNQSNCTDNTYSVVGLSGGASAFVTGVNICDNVINANGPFNRYKALVEIIGSAIGDNSRWNVCNNTGSWVAALVSGSPVSTIRYRNNSCTTAIATVKRSDDAGRSTQSGNGSATAFTIAHSLFSAPTHVAVTPGSTDAKGSFYATADATNITVTYDTAPISGTNNVVLNWQAYV